MSLSEILPFAIKEVALPAAGNVGLVIVDPGVGFTRCGALADPKSMAPMVKAIDNEYRSLRQALGHRLHLLVFLDVHHDDIPEPPYPPHCITGTGEDQIDPDLEWLLHEPSVTLIEKDCINGFVGAINRQTGENAFCNWMTTHNIGQLLVVGDCTDICVSDFVVTALSARNHGLFTTADPRAERPRYIREVSGLEVAVLARACATFDAPGFHPSEPSHHVGLWLMASRGATIAHHWVA